MFFLFKHPQVVQHDLDLFENIKESEKCRSGIWCTWRWRPPQRLIAPNCLWIFNNFNWPKKGLPTRGKGMYICDVNSSYLQAAGKAAVGGAEVAADAQHLPVVAIEHVEVPGAALAQAAPRARARLLYRAEQLLAPAVQHPVPLLVVPLSQDCTYTYVKISSDLLDSIRADSTSQDLQLNFFLIVNSSIRKMPRNFYCLFMLCDFFSIAINSRNVIINFHHRIDWVFIIVISKYFFVVEYHCSIE